MAPHMGARLILGRELMLGGTHKIELVIHTIGTLQIQETRQNFIALL